MTDEPMPVDFDTRPPMPVTEYEQTVRRVNVGYELALTLTHCFLRGLRVPDLRLLVVGAGGGAEIEWFLPQNPGWLLTGVDPSRDMLALAQSRAAALGVESRTTLIQGGVEAVPEDARFDAATCLFVLHFLPDPQKLSLLRETVARLKPGSPLIVLSGVRPADEGLRDDFLAAWQQYGELMGMPAESMAQIIQQLLGQMERAITEEGCVRLLNEAGLTRVARFFSALGGMVGWIAR